MTLAALICVGLLGWLGYYLWHYDYYAGPPETPVAVSAVSQLKANLRICDGTEFYCTPGVWACFVFVNTGTLPIRLIDTRALTPPYEVKLVYHDPNGRSVQTDSIKAAGLSASPSTAMRYQGFSPDRDSVVELPPGRALTRLIPLSQMQAFDLKREGKYELAVTYKPGALALPNGQTLASLQVYSQELRANASFQLPLPKSPEPEARKPAEKPEPQAKTEVGN